ncbi:MAG: AAA domain-containing protein [Chloroflexi bacterium]|nr:AAA domain-containing protein [Chloroflexota bacterium]
MARLPRYELLYDAFEQFLNRCILNNQSLLWPNEEVWTPENVAEVKRQMVDAPALGEDLSFEDKLKEQMTGVSPQHWMILCDVYYVYFLPSSFITLEKRHTDIHWAAHQGGQTPPPADAEIWQAQEAGFTRTSLRYHYKYSQFWLILLFANRLKESTDPEPILRDPQEMQRLLDEILESIPSKNDRAYDMRHAMLYLAFPDHYERSISTRDKQSIIKTYHDQLKEPVPNDLDQAIRQIRAALSDRFDELDHPFDFYDHLMGEWRPKHTPPAKKENADQEPTPVRVEPTLSMTEGDIPDNDDLLTVISILDRTRNVILYGPPGTGKTYIAKRVAEALVEPQTRQPLSKPAAIQRVIENLASWEVIALGMYLAGPKGNHSVSEILDMSVVQTLYRISPVKQPRQNVWGHLQWHTSLESETVKVIGRREPYLFDKDDQSRWSLTDVGQEYIKENLAEQMHALRPSEVTDVTTAEFIKWATFHQSYAYEDFVEGLRPVQSDESPGDVSYEIVPGVFKRICSRAGGDPSNKYVLVIDEINRGNIAKILGELISLLEDDKRIGEKNALSVTLPYSGESFSVPANLYIIGTMNTADRSIALLDVALRRRFAFVELMPRAKLLDGAQVESAEAFVPLDDLLCSLNQGIRKYLDRDHQIGHSYFMTVSQASKEEQVQVLEFVWNNQIVPLMEEYFYSQRDRLAELLAPFRTDVEPDIQDAQDMGLDFEIGRQTGDDLVIALAKLAQRHK